MLKGYTSSGSRRRLVGPPLNPPLAGKEEDEMAATRFKRKRSEDNTTSMGLPSMLIGLAQCCQEVAYEMMKSNNHNRLPPAPGAGCCSTRILNHFRRSVLPPWRGTQIPTLFAAHPRRR
ncbi:unnamed protein product [Linum trigynum]|uniref:Uncharacterized protein n=1 Tax=Linum trigynum TaxID=586398 RepID=A0AAV2CDS6_9ROSI